MIPNIDDREEKTLIFESGSFSNETGILILLITCFFAEIFINSLNLR